MAVITIRNREDETKARLRRQAALHGRSMEEEARTILKAALGNNESESGTALTEAIRTRVVPVGGIGLEIPERDALPMTPDPSA